MRAIKNSVQLIGNLGRDVEVFKFDTGNKKATFTMATTESYTNKNGEKTDDTQWHNIVAWGKTADLMSTLLEKGNQVLVKGKIVNRTYEDKEGNKKYITEIVAQEFMKLTKKDLPF